MGPHAGHPRQPLPVWSDGFDHVIIGRGCRRGQPTLSARAAKHRTRPGGRRPAFRCVSCNAACAFSRRQCACRDRGHPVPAIDPRDAPPPPCAPVPIRRPSPGRPTPPRRRAPRPSREPSTITIPTASLETVVPALVEAGAPKAAGDGAVGSIKPPGEGCLRRSCS